MSFSANEISLCRYEISDVTLQIDGGSSINLSNEKGIQRVKEIEIIEDFEKNVFPIFRLVVIVESSIYKKILRHKNSVNVTLTINKYFSPIDSNDKHHKQRFLNEKLQLVMNDNVEDLMYTQRLQANLDNYRNAEKDDKHDLQMVDNAMELYLFKSSSLDGTKSSNTNVILKNATVTDGMAYLASSAKLNNILMSPPDNTDRYPVLLIPPLSILKAFLYMDVYYGLYRTGSLIYFGLDRTYIIKYTGGCTAYAPNESKVVTITIPRTDNTFKSAVLGQIGNNTFIGDFHTLDISNDSIPNNYISGNGVQVADSYTGDIDASVGSALNKNTSFLRILENKTENEYLSTMYTKRSESNSIVVRVNLQDIDVSVFTPNKMYKISFEDSSIANQYEGNFFLSYARHSFINTGKAMTVNTELVLKKLEK